MFARTKIYLFILLQAGLILTAAGCSPKLARITAADNGSQLSLNAGQQFAVTLEGNPTTGFTWEAQDLDSVYLQQMGNPTFTSDNPNLVGSGGTQTLTFKALKAGTTTLMLVYHRPWESVAPIDTFTLTVTIR